MSIYTNIKNIPLPNGLDELGLRFGLVRFQDETLDTFRRRINAIISNEPSSTEDSLFENLSINVGLFPTLVFVIDLVLDNDVPIAEDPYIEITSSYFRAYNNYTENEIDIEVNIIDREDAWFLSSIKEAIDASDYFNIEIIDDSYTFKKSKNLRFCNTKRIRTISSLANNSVNNLEVTNIANFYPENIGVFLNEKNTLDDLTSDGDFYIDYYNGIIFSYSFASGFAVVEYQEFPFNLYWEPVKAYPLKDSDTKYMFFNEEIQSDGTVDNTKLNSQGAFIYNKILAANPLGWGR